MSATVPVTEIPFRDVLRLGSTGTQPVAVKRGLWHAGFRHGWDSLDSVAIAAEVLGPTAAENLKRYQTYFGVDADGIYGPVTHGYLRGSFDRYAVMLYLKEPPGPAPLQLPATFTPTHPTSGLPGYPARDFFAAPGTRVLAPVDGIVTKLSGRDPREGGKPGGAYGWSLYLTHPHGIYYLTHFGTRSALLGETVRRGDPIGTVCDAQVAHMDSSLSHIHEGLHAL